MVEPWLRFPGLIGNPRMIGRIYGPMDTRGGLYDSNFKSSAGVVKTSISGMGWMILTTVGDVRHMLNCLLCGERCNPQESLMDCPRCKFERCKVERWKPVTGFEQYQISDHGRIRSQTGLLMHPGKLQRGHLRVSFSVNKVRTSFQVHHLVLLAFVGPRPEGLEGLHNNDDPGDNCFKNLRWGTHSENMRDAVINGRMPHVHAAVLRKKIVAGVVAGESVRSEVQRSGIPRRTIYDWLREAQVTPQ